MEIETSRPGFTPTVTSKTLKYIIGAAGVVCIGLTVPVPTFLYANTGGLYGSGFIFGLLLMLSLTDQTLPGEPPVSLGEKLIWVVPNALFIAFLLFYAYTQYSNSESIQAGAMPESWSLFGWIICVLLFVQLALVVKGGGVACYSWLTMSFLSVFVAMHFILAENFKTNG